MGKRKKQKQVEMNDAAAKAGIVTEPAIAESEGEVYSVKFESVEDVKRAIIYSEIINRKY